MVISFVSHLYREDNSGSSSRDEFNFPLLCTDSMLGQAEAEFI